MNELQIIEKRGVVISTELPILLDKSIQAIINQLNSLEDRNMIKVLIFKSQKHRRKVYVKNELYNDICKASKSVR